MFMNYLEEQTDGEAMINSIKNGDQPLPRVTQVSIAGNLSTDQPSLKDKSMCYKTTKDLWDALARHMLSSEYGEQDRKAAVLYEYETFKATEGELLLDTYIRYLQVINDLKKCGYSNDNCELNFKFLNNIQPEWKQYVTMMRQNKNLMDINIDALYNILKQNLGDVNDAMGLKKKTVVVTSDPLALIYEKTKEGHFAKDCKKVKVKDYEYYNTKMLLAKKDKDEQILLTEEQAWMESSSDSDQEINANMVFMAQIDKVLSDSEDSTSSDDDKISEVSYYQSEYESESEYETLEYYDNTTTYGLFVNDNDDQEIFYDCKNCLENLIESLINHKESAVDHNDSEGVDKLIRKFNKKIAKCLKRIEKANQQNKDFENQNKDLQDKYDVLKDQLQVKHVVIDTHVECQEKYAKLEAERYEYMIIYSAYFDNDKQHRKQIADQKVLYDKMSVQLVELDKHVRDLKNTVLDKDFKISKLEECVRNKDLEIEKCLERLNVCENKLHKMGQTNQTVHMIMPSKDTLYNGRKGIGFENPSYFEKAKDLRPSLYDEKVIGLGYTPTFLTHSNKALEIKKFKRARENKIEFAYDYGTNEFAQTVCSDCDFRKIIIDLEDEVVSLLEKEKANLETIESLKSKGFESSENTISESKNQSQNDCQVVEKECDQVENSKVIAPGMFKLSVSQKLDTFSSVRRPKHNDVIWKKKGSSNTSNVDFSSVNHIKLNKDVKRYFRKDLLSCSNSHLGETSSAYVFNDAINVPCNSRLYDSFDENSLFIFDDESVRISPVSKIPFRKKPCNSLNIVQICLWIIDSGCSKHMTGNRALLTKFVEKFLETVRFGNNDFAVIAGYGYVVIGSMTIKKVYYVEGLGHNLFNAGQFCNKGLEVAFQKSTFFVQNEYDVDLLTGDRSLNLYTIALNEVASNSLTCLLEKASSSQSWLWHQRLSYLNFATINNLVKNNLIQAIATACFTQNHSIIYKRFDKTPYELTNKRKPNIKFFCVFGCRCCLLNDYEDVGKLKAKRDIGVFVGYSKESAAFRIYNKRTRKIHRSVNVNFDEISELASRKLGLEPDLSNLNETGKGIFFKRKRNLLHLL
nr:integrase, catalytic region, zinc finger, CCHC-type, peptidase aspartic, catalytic [Tanacetum cinerariifolium]